MAMAEDNEHVVEELIKDLKLSNTIPAEVSENDDSTEFQDLECIEERTSSESESDYEDIVNSEESQLTEKEIEETKTKVLEIKEKGNELFRNGNHTEACQLYSEALKLCPCVLNEQRSMLYNNRAAAKAKQGLKEGALKDCTKALDLNPVYVKALFRRAKLYEELDQLDKALADYQELHKLDPNNLDVKCALVTLPKRIEEQTEKLKKEMFGKMKDLGNMILKPFGLSTDNFQINQDPVTGSYSVNMSK